MLKDEDGDYTATDSESGLGSEDNKEEITNEEAHTTFIPLVTFTNLTLFSLWIVYQGRSSQRRHKLRSQSQRNGRLSLVLPRHPALPRKHVWRKLRMNLQLKLSHLRCVTFTVTILKLTHSYMKGLKSWNPIHLFYMRSEVNAQKNHGNEGDKHYKCCHSEGKILTITKHMKYATNGEWFLLYSDSFSHILPMP